MSIRLRITHPAGITIHEDLHEYCTGKQYFFIRYSTGQTISIPREDIYCVERLYDNGIKEIRLKTFRKKERMYDTQSHQC